MTGDNDLLTTFSHLADMMRWLGMFLLALGACTVPKGYFANAPATRITVDNSVFDVRRRGELAEAVRVNPEYAPRFGPIRARAGKAIEIISGCQVREVLGDQAVATGLLDCDGTGRALRLPRSIGEYDCIEVDQWSSRGFGMEYTEFECTAI